MDYFTPLASDERVQLYSFQQGYGEEQLAGFESANPVIDLGRIVDKEASFTDTAAIMKNLDLVITSDTSISHVAGAIGIPVWTLLGLAPDWRWLQNRADSPWYPSMRLFRQIGRGDWENVFRDVITALPINQSD